MRSPSLRWPVSGVLCDRYMCANDKGISRALTAKCLGGRVAARLISQGAFDLSKFTFAKRVFCDLPKGVAVPRESLLGSGWQAQRGIEEIHGAAFRAVQPAVPKRGLAEGTRH
jgi:hypothetical protein